MSHTEKSLAIVISDLGGGGAQRVLMHLLKTWVKDGCCITVITLMSSKSSHYILPSEVNHISLNLTTMSNGLLSGVLNNFYRIIRIRKTLKTIRPDIVISFIGTTNILTIFASWFLNHKVVISERNDPSRQSLGTMWDLLRKRIYKFADIVTANSFSAINYMKSYVPEDKLMYVPNPVVLPDNIKRIEMSQPRFLAVGRLHSQKAYDVLVTAVSLSQMRNKGWKLSVLGDGPDYKKLEKLSEAKCVSDLISWEGYIKDPYPYYISSSVFIMTSMYEGMPNALLEAMSAGMPCIVSDSIDAVKELDSNGSIFKIVEHGNASKLAEKMDELTSLPDYGKSLGEFAKQRVLSDMSLEKTILSWNKVFDALEFT